VKDELKRVFYLTHTKTGARRRRPLKNRAFSTLAMIQACDASSFIQNEEEFSD